VITKIYAFSFFLAACGALRAADEQLLALSLRAQTDFDRVQAAAGPELPDATRCEQSQAALLSVASPADLTQTHFRKGYCTLAAALVTRHRDDFLQAAGEFEEALKAWPEHTARAPKNHPVEPLSSGLRVLAPIARMEDASGHPDAAALARDRTEIASALEQPVCPASFMPVPTCDSLLNTGKLWLGWIALQQDDLYQAARDLSTLPDSAWAHYAAGKTAFHDRQYAQAAAEFGKAVDLWKQAQQDAAAPLAARLAPRPDLPEALADWGGAQFLTGNTSAAISTLDAAVRTAPDPARALFLRARAEEQAGRLDPALADYSLASRTALAHAQDLASGEAHLYRGILLYRRKEFAQAENEFASALNFDIPKALRPDAIAWRHMAAVRQGGCAASRSALEDSLATVSPYFPKDEARAVASSCPLTGSAVSRPAV
jgi:tetratricopeptide (TPR) repeat protein